MAHRFNNSQRNSASSSSSSSSSDDGMDQLSRQQRRREMNAWKSANNRMGTHHFFYSRLSKNPSGQLPPTVAPIPLGCQLQNPRHHYYFGQGSQTNLQTMTPPAPSFPFMSSPAVQKYLQQGPFPFLRSKSADGVGRVATPITTTITTTIPTTTPITTTTTTENPGITSHGLKWRRDVSQNQHLNQPVTKDQAGQMQSSQMGSLSDSIIECKQNQGPRTSKQLEGHRVESQPNITTTAPKKNKTSNDEGIPKNPENDLERCLERLRSYMAHQGYVAQQENRRLWALIYEMHSQHKNLQDENNKLLTNELRDIKQELATLRNYVERITGPTDTVGDVGSLNIPITIEGDVKAPNNPITVEGDVEAPNDPITVESDVEAPNDPITVEGDVEAPNDPITVEGDVEAPNDPTTVEGEDANKAESIIKE